MVSSYDLACSAMRAFNVLGGCTGRWALLTCWQWQANTGERPVVLAVVVGRDELVYESAASTASRHSDPIDESATATYPARRGHPTGLVFNRGQRSTRCGRERDRGKSSWLLNTGILTRNNIAASSCSVAVTVCWVAVFEQKHKCQLSCRSRSVDFGHLPTSDACVQLTTLSVSSR